MALRWPRTGASCGVSLCCFRIRDVHSVCADRVRICGIRALHLCDDADRIEPNVDEDQPQSSRYKVMVGLLAITPFSMASEMLMSPLPMVHEVETDVSDPWHS